MKYVHIYQFWQVGDGVFVVLRRPYWRVKTNEYSWVKTLCFEKVGIVWSNCVSFSHFWWYDFMQVCNNMLAKNIIMSGYPLERKWEHIFRGNIKSSAFPVAVWRCHVTCFAVVNVCIVFPYGRMKTFPSIWCCLLNLCNNLFQAKKILK